MPTSHMTTDILPKSLQKTNISLACLKLDMCLIPQSQTPQHIQDQFNLQILVFFIYMSQSV